MKKGIWRLPEYPFLHFEAFMILRNFSKRTIKTYMQIVLQFTDGWIVHHDDQPMCDDAVRQYLLYRFEAGKAWQTANSDYSAIQKWFKNVLMLQWNLTKLPRPKKEKHLPFVFSREDIVKIIKAAPTFKQQVLLTLFYVTGVRLSEAIHIRIEDIDGNRKQIRILKGKGNKDRYILIPDLMLHMLRQFYFLEKPQIYLFNDAKPGNPYSPRSVQLILQEAKKSSECPSQRWYPYASQWLRNTSSRRWHGLGISTRTDGTQKSPYHHPLHWTVCRKTSTYSPSDQWHAYSLSSPHNSIGALFREHGEQFIHLYHPSREQIRFIQSVRNCRTDALGYTQYTCKNCIQVFHIYKSCGHSQCPVCQSIKREQWIDKLQSKSLNVPYVHIIFTLPHQIHSLTRRHRSLIYSLLMRAAWRTVKDAFQSLHALPNV